jgi:hypothetical protein
LGKRTAQNFVSAGRLTFRTGQATIPPDALPPPPLKNESENWLRAERRLKERENNRHCGAGKMIDRPWLEYAKLHFDKGDTYDLECTVGDAKEVAAEIERLQKRIAEERTACMRIALSFERDYGREVGRMARRIAEVIQRRGD